MPRRGRGRLQRRSPAPLRSQRPRARHWTSATDSAQIASERLSDGNVQGELVVGFIAVERESDVGAQRREAEIVAEAKACAPFEIGRLIPMVERVAAIEERDDAEIIREAITHF